MKDISYYTNLVTSQYKNKPNFMSWLGVLIQPFIDIGICADNMYLDFDLDNAVGVQQDMLGEILGVSRILPYQPIVGSAVLSDANYKILLKAKIIQNHWNGKISNIETLWNLLFNNSYIIIVDHQDMTLDVVIAGYFSDVVTEMIMNGLIIPCPEGVKLNLGIDGGPVVIEPSVFGYDEQDAVIAGYGVGHWR